MCNNTFNDNIVNNWIGLNLLMSYKSLSIRDSSSAYIHSTYYYTPEIISTSELSSTES